MSTSQLQAAVPLIVADVCSPLYFSVVLFTGIFGVTSMQTFYYFVHYPNDPLSLKLFVAVVWALDTIHLGLTISGVYKYIMGGLENLEALLSGVPELIVQGLAGTLAGLPTQAYLVYRIYVLTGKSLVAPILWVIPAIYQIVSSVVGVAKAFYGLHVIPITELSDSFFLDFIESELVVAAVIDTAIAIAMIILLFRQRSMSGFASTLHIVQLLTIFAVNTGLWTAVFAILSVIMMHLYPESLLYLVFAVPLSAIYSNALLANLNGRSYIRRQGMNKQDSAGAEMLVINHSPCGDVVMTTTGKESTGKRFSSRIFVGIRKTTETETFRDVESSESDLPAKPIPDPGNMA